MLQNIPLEQAQSILNAQCKIIGKETIRLNDALGRVLAEEIVAKEDIPPFARSPFDGYAFRASDTQNASRANPVTLTIIEEVPAGYAPTKQVTPGTAVKILTGAPIPEGADTVVKYEDTEFTETEVRLFSPSKSGENIVSAGEDVAQGTVLVEQGTVITAPVLGLLAALGAAEVAVYRRPRIAILSTGDELLEVSEPLLPGKIRNSNSYTLQGYLQSCGVEPVVIGIAKDKKEEVAAKIEEGLAQADMIISTGGASVGDYDVVKDALKLLGAEILYWQIDIKPGSATLAAHKDGKLIIGLSGNPASAMVILQLMVLPVIKKMAGRAVYANEKIQVILKDDFPKASPRRRFLRGMLVFENGLTYMQITGGQGNAVLSSMIGCNLLAEIPGGSGPVKAGERLTAYLVDC
jgi:molybdopterin molybdotransferase